VIVHAGSKSHEQLLEELEALRRRVAELEALETTQTGLEKALRESESRYRQVVETAYEGVWIIDAECRTVFVNRRLAEMLDEEPERMIGASIFSFMGPKWQEVAREFIGLEREGKAAAGQYDFKFLRRDGAELWAIIKTTPIFDREGRFSGILGMLTDITDRKLAETDLKGKEAQYRGVFDAAGEGLIIADLDGAILEANPEACRIYGYSHEELTKIRVTDFMHPDSRHLFSTHVEQTSVSPMGLAVETVNLRKDGTPIQVEVRSTEFQYNGAKHLLAIVRDITARKRAEESLGFAQFTIDHAAEHISWIGKDGRYLYVNHAACKSLGYSRKEMLDLTVKAVDPSIAEGNAWERYWQMVKAKGAYTSESKLRTKDFREVPVEVTSNYLQFDTSEFQVSFVRDVTERKKAEVELKRQLDRLAALRTIDTAITSSLDLRITFDVILAQTIEQLNVDAAAILLLNPLFNRLEYAAGRGFRTSSLRHTSLPIGEGFAGVAALERRIVSVADLEKEASPFLARAPLLREEGFVSYYSAPLIAKAQVKGVLEIFHRSSLSPDQTWLDFLAALAGQAAIAIDNAVLFEDLQRANIELRLAYDHTLEGWSRALDLRDRETEGHSERVAEMTLRLARTMGVSEGELVNVRRGALLHDIGKVGIPDNILLKPGPLTPEEMEVMQKHPVYAYNILWPISFLRPAVEIPYCHHERWDGRGYPRGLRGEEIPVSAQIFAVADVWDALRSNRPYRPVWPREKTLAHICANNGTHFNPKVVEAFVDLIANFDTPSNPGT
jgi:PAS domain S-box-containing protein